MTYFVSDALFLDLSYAYGKTESYDGNYASTFANPDDHGRQTQGTLVGSSSGHLETQTVSVTLNWAF